MTTQSLTSVPVTATVLYQDKPAASARAVEMGNDLWLPLPTLQAVTGWELKPEGVCRDETCVPLPDNDRSRYFRQEGRESWFNLSAFAQLVQQPVAHDQGRHAWYLGPLGWEWQDRLASQEAPNFTLADLEGRRFSLSQFRGKKVLLALWASW